MMTMTTTITRKEGAPKFTTRREAEPDDIATVMSDFMEKLDYMLNVRKGWQTWSSRHEIAGILAEEFGVEFMNEVHDKSPEGMERELFDIAIAALFGIVSIRKGLDW